jgi:hypothetical protein
MEYLDGFEDGYPPYSYTRDGSFKREVFPNLHFDPMMPMVMIPLFGRETWWTITAALTHFPPESIQSSGKPFL